jgi:hypothetical protein
MPIDFPSYCRYLIPVFYYDKQWGSGLTEGKNIGKIIMVSISAIIISIGRNGV